MSRYIVAVDLEGTACALPQLGGTVETSFNIEWVRRQATREANAACRALLDAGADDVIVWDNHGRGCSLDPDLLDSRVRIAMGATIYQRFPVIDDSVTGVLLVGYHAMEGTPDAVMAHTFSSVTFQYMKINGQEVGEMAFDAGCAGRHGVPVIFVSSCNKGCAEANAWMPWAETVAVKESLAFTRILSLHPEAAVREIYDGVTRAVAASDRMKPLRFPEPATIEVRFKRLDDAQHFMQRDMEGRAFAFKDPFTRVGTLRTLEDFVAQPPGV